MDAFPLLLIALLSLIVGGGIGLAVGLQLAARRPATLSADDARAGAAITADAVAPVRESLDRFTERLAQLESSRIEWHSQLREQVESVRLGNDSLRKETASLATALRRPQVRGSWGEMHLRRTAELAGMLDHCDFDLQVSVRDGDNVLRPDMVVRLAGRKTVVVDSKVPLDAYLDATQADDERDVAAHLQRHARQLRGHVDQLAAKSYWRQFDAAPEFVVLFVPGEAILSAALEVEPVLLEYASAKRVVLATPTTLIALLRTVAYAWTQEQLADNAREIQAIAHEMYERIGTVATHVDGVGRALDGAVRSYNSAVGSLETRLLVTARRFHDLHVGDSPVDTPRIVEQTSRVLTAPELADELP